MPVDLTKAQPLQAAVDEISAKTPVGSALRSKDWEKLVPDGLKAGAIWSAGVESVRVADSIQKKLGLLLGEIRDAKHEGLAMDRSKFVRDIQAMANAEGLRTQDQAKRGTVVDFGSERRMKLILEQQIGAAQAKAYYQQGQDPDVLDAFPALELVRVRSVTNERDWNKRWEEAAKAVNYAGVAKGTDRKIALKSSPIWRKLSRFNRPYPPFDYNSGMGVEEVDRETCEDIGLLKPGEAVAPTENAWNEELQASVRGLDPAQQEKLKLFFGDQVKIENGVASWRGTEAVAAGAVPGTAKVTTKAAKSAKDNAKTGTALGKSVSEALDYAAAPQKAKLERTQAIVDSVHGDGQLPTITVIKNTTEQGAAGYYHHKQKPGSMHIGITEWNGHAELTLAHEIGHFLSDHVLEPGMDAFDSMDGPECAEWRQAISNSKARMRLDFQRSKLKPSTRAWKEYNYLLSPWELWARSYAQFIAEESGDKVLLDQVEMMRKNYPNTHWSTDDFAPIRAAMKTLFQKKGWMK